MKPDIFIIDRSLTNVNVSIRCPTRPVQSVNCSFTCQVILPCHCDLTSSIGFIPQRVDNCVRQRNIQVQHNVNLALLQNFFSESELRDISGDTLLSDPLKVRLSAATKMQFSLPVLPVSHLLLIQNVRLVLVFSIVGLSHEMSYTTDSIRYSIRIVTPDSIRIRFECKRPIRRSLV